MANQSHLIAYQNIPEPLLTFNPEKDDCISIHPLKGLIEYGPYNQKLIGDAFPIIRIATIGPKGTHKIISELINKLKSKQTPQESEETDDFQRFSVGDLTKKVQELLKKLDAFTQNLFALYKRLSKEESKRVELDRAYRENMDAMQIFKEQLYRVVHISKWEIFLLILIVCNIGMLFLRFHLAFILSLFLFQNKYQ